MPLRTRFAPSPTGYLHLGHAVHLLYVWGIARAVGAEIMLRIEDHDRQRCRPEYEATLLEDLEWLGLEPDLLARPLRQHERHARYLEVTEQLRARGLVYACDCSRATILRRTGQTDGELRYDNHCRNAATASSPLLRVRLDPVPQRFHDHFLRQSIVQIPALQCGDLPIRDRHGQWTYQFCVVVDDLDDGVNLVVRGEDLLPSTGRQLQLAWLLGHTRTVHFLHHPVLVDSGGRKLSKRDFDKGLYELRQDGMSGSSVLGMAAHLAGLAQTNGPVRAADLPELMFSDDHLKAAILGLWNQLSPHANFS